MAIKNTGWSTPLSSSSSSSSNLSSPAYTPIEVSDDFPFENCRIPASTVIEFIASRQSRSSSVYVYDVAEQVGFGTLTKEWAKAADDSLRIIDLQTRPGAGLSLVGRLSQGTSRDAAKATLLTAYSTPNGLAFLAPSFTLIPKASPTSRLVIQAPTATPVGKDFSLSPTLSSLASVWPILSKNITILFSSTPQQAVDFATISYQVTDAHIIHFFDHHSACREIGHPTTPLHIPKKSALTLREAFNSAGYEFFEYHGRNDATSVVVLLNGPLALQLKDAFINQSDPGLGVVIVNTFSPWDAAALQSITPLTAKKVHVLDDVPNTVTQGSLYVDVFESLWNGSPERSIQSHRVLPTQTQAFLKRGGFFLDFIKTITGVQVPKSSSSPLKKLLFFSTPLSPLSSLPHSVQQLFVSTNGIKARLLEDHDFLSKSGGLTASRLLVSRKDVHSVPIPFSLPLDSSSEGHSDFLAILEQNLLKTHSLLQHARTGSTVLVISTWTVEELFSNLPPGAISFIRERNLSLYLIDVQATSRKIVGSQSLIQDTIQNLLIELAILRIYLGKSANEGIVLQLAGSSFPESIGGIALAKYNAHAWSSLRHVVIPNIRPATTPPPSLQNFESNAIVIDSKEGAVVNGARLSNWHDAAKHLIFPSNFTTKTADHDTQNHALRPEISDQTYLVTCTVNRRLTPADYDRNVFHLEFDTSGTGLRYAIGEALGVHGWNDEQEVLEFCEWYGVDPHRLVTIPLPGDDNKMHTRTVFQALQQQIDVFGKPPKSFYTDLAEYAADQVDRYALRFIGSPEGIATFKKLSEKDTVTFADVLQMYPSARPGIERLCEMVGDTKPRHYSIASSQSVVGDRVDLLVVTVDWVTPSGTL